MLHKKFLKLKKIATSHFKILVYSYLIYKRISLPIHGPSSNHGLLLQILHQTFISLVLPTCFTLNKQQQMFNFFLILKKLELIPGQHSPKPISVDYLNARRRNIAQVKTQPEAKLQSGKCFGDFLSFLICRQGVQILSLPIY